MQEENFLILEKAVSKKVEGEANPGLNKVEVPVELW